MLIPYFLPINDVPSSLAYQKEPCPFPESWGVLGQG